MIKKYSTQACLASISLLLTLSAYAVPTSEVIFEKGSECGHYKGDLTTGREFIVEMKANQALIVKTDGHVQTVSDNKGNALDDKGGAHYRYESKNQGTHRLKMVGRADSEADFCIS